MKKQNLAVALTCFQLAFAIILGALGAHKLKELLPADNLGSFKTGVEYHLYHSLALVGLYTIPFFSELQGIRVVRTLFIAGIACFSGSIYLLSTASVTGLESLNPFLGPVTPIGGLLLISGWILLGFRSLKK